jgi:hypothetical protein
MDVSTNPSAEISRNCFEGHLSVHSNPTLCAFTLWMPGDALVAAHACNKFLAISYMPSEMCTSNLFTVIRKLLKCKINPGVLSAQRGLHAWTWWAHADYPMWAWLTFQSLKTATHVEASIWRCRPGWKLALVFSKIFQTWFIMAFKFYTSCRRPTLMIRVSSFAILF